MYSRIRKLRQQKALTQSEFGARIGVKGNTITNYENNLRNPSDAIINSICREFNVREQWLRTGEGDMFNPINRDEEIMAFISSSLSADGEVAEFQKRLFTVLSRLSVEEWRLILDKIKELQAED